MDNIKYPKHLEKILRVTEYEDVGNISGKIVCECGCEKFGIRYFGENYPPHCVTAAEVSEHIYACVIKAVCRSCGKEWELFDFSKHSYDGMFCEESATVSDDKLINAVEDDERDFEITMSMEFDDEEQFTEEVINNPCEERKFMPDDRLNIWSWLVIDLKCCKSGKELDGFVDIELA